MPTVEKIKTFSLLLLFSYCKGKANFLKNKNLPDLSWKKFRISTHPANGDRMSNDKMDMGISVLVYKNGVHSSDGTIPWKEFKYVLTSNNDKDNVLRKRGNHLSEGRQSFPGKRVNLIQEKTK